jgi:predicted metal-binding membrane protein
VPVEKQARAPLTRRDKQLITAVCIALLAVAGALAVTLATRQPGHRSGCVEVTLPSTMGGARIRRCGADARAFCRQQRSIAAVAEACRHEGYPA